MSRLLFTVSYDGSNYHGFQRQTNDNSIQAEIEKAIKRMTRLDVTIHSAGRTDKGVHALNQTFHFDTDLEISEFKWIEGLNKRLPSDIIIKDVKIVEDNFHARHSAKYREYYYYIAKRPSTIYTQRFESYIDNFDIKLAIEASKFFIGTKDFKPFSKQMKDKDTIRTISSILVKETDNHYIFKFTGVSFLRYMVRSIMGMIIDCAIGKRDISDIDLIFNNQDRSKAATTASAKGLFLNRVIY